MGDPQEVEGSGVASRSEPTAGGAARTLDAVIATNVRARRAAARLRQPDLAKAMVRLGESAWNSEATVSKVEGGKRPVSVSELVALGLALGATPDELLDPVGVAGDWSPVELAGLTWSARKLRAVVRGEARVGVTFDEAGKAHYRISPTDRSDPTAVLAMFAGRPDAERGEGESS
jgi:transcriptional regulator with XRE-family HTH domain